MRIIVDADACPGRQIIEDLGKEYGLEVIMYCDINHALFSDYSSIRYMDSGFQSVDMAIANEARVNDIVVTQDFGVAAMVLGKKAHAIGPKGFVYTNENIDKLLFERHIAQKIRRSGGKTSNPKKRTREDDERLHKNLEKLIVCNKK
ncbi:YaiI/YqxD family protein [Clostridium omnivorum]|uniref:UPF0178 protein bsdE14_28340 n=1 Tax=Clostridium omnivorum TaxID=1604902 RepID=A0ABQ5N864_9CLOT|nr:YaiI/YqxD family protein [Clostridium sp. E14]GLC31424.1 DUF188 domain-containing protein [Clostridium sp. E14]